jgi:hypothetical protein
MAMPKNSKSALWALAATSGLWLWQNRDKVGSWLKQKQSDLQQATSNMSQQANSHGDTSSMSNAGVTQPTGSGSYTTPSDSFRTTTGGNFTTPNSTGYGGNTGYTGQTRRIGDEDSPSS